MSNPASADTLAEGAARTTDTFALLIEQLTDMWVGFVQILPQMAIALFVLLVTWLVAKLARRIVTRIAGSTSMRRSLQELFHTIAGIGVWVIGIMLAAAIVVPGITPGSLLAGLGIGAVAIGFAFQDIFENFLAGVLIMIREKMRIGDIIECEGIIGKVEQISLRETHIREMSGELNIVPNSILFKNPLEILTDATQRRHEVVAGVSYDTDLEQAQKVILDAVKTADGVDTDKGIDVFAREFNASSVDFTVRWWAGSKPRAMHETRDTVIRAIKRALDDAGIEIPFPYITHTFKEPVPMADAKKFAMPRRRRANATPDAASNTGADSTPRRGAMPPETQAFLGDIGGRLVGYGMRNLANRSIISNMVQQEAREQLVGRGLRSSLLGYFAARVATRSLPGAVFVGGLLVLKTVRDRRKADRAVRRENTVKD